jgi:hypothetical protein
MSKLAAAARPRRLVPRPKPVDVSLPRRRRPRARGRDPVRPEVAAKAMWDRDPATEIILRGAVPPASTTGSTWASALATSAVDDTIAAATSISAAADLISRGLKVNFDGYAQVNVPGRVVNAAAAGAWVAEGLPIPNRALWSGFAELLRECGTRNRQLLQVRDELQSRIDQYHRERSGEPLDLGEYERFLRDIGYVLPEGHDFTIRTTKRPRVDRRRIFCPKNDHRTVLDKDNNEHRLKFSPCVTPKQESGGPADEAIERVKAVPGESRSTYKPRRGAAV